MSSTNEGTLRSTEVMRSLTALVAGITIMSFKTVHTSDTETRWAGERDTMCALMVARVGDTHLRLR